MRAEWKRVRLGEHITTQKGFAFKSKWYTVSGRPIVKVSDFTADSVDASSLVAIPEAIAKAYLRYKLSEGDAVIQTVGSWPSNPQSVVGKAIRVPRNASGALLNQNAVKIIPGNDLDNAFLFYLLKSGKFKEYIVGTAQGAASQASITLDSIRFFAFDLPPRNLQTRIATILSAYDDLIENNLRRIKILEEMAQMIYCEWFVHFRFPGHEKVKIVDSPIGKTPEGWEVLVAPECLAINPSIRVDKNTIKPFVNMGGLSDNSMIVEQTDIRKGSNGSKFQKGDTLFARITPCLENGKTGFVQFLCDKEVGLGSTEFIVLRSINLSPEFVYLLARTEDFRNNAIKSMSGASGRQRVRNECFDKYLLAKPENDIIDKFTNTVKPMFEKIYKLSLKNKNLCKTRDLLLPKLISGGIEV